MINLADNREDIDSYIKLYDFNSPYYKMLYDSGKVVALSMPVDFSSENFQKDLVNGIKKIVTNKMSVPLHIHCTEGKDRAGFTSALLESLMGADYNEIVNDYMISYKNYYGITKDTDSVRYDVIVKNNINEMLKVIGNVSKVEDMTVENLSKGARDYLEQGGMSKSQIEALVDLLK